MESQKLPTEFAPAERATNKEIVYQTEKLSSISLVKQAFDTIPHIVFLLNSYRQIIYANRASFDILKVKDMDEISGLRPGEILGCQNASKTTGGCGTTKSCQTCGAVLAILAAQERKKKSLECRITRKNGGGALDLLVCASPLEIDGELFTVVSATDTSHEKRRRALERIFFHDVLNTVTAIQSATNLLKNPKEAEIPDLAGILSHYVNKLVEEIQAQKDLVAAENNELVVKPVLTSSLEFMEEIIDLYKFHQSAGNNRIKLDPSASKIEFVSDKTLLRRVISNLLVNALEASDTNNPITLGCDAEDKFVRFWVHNEESMPEDIQLQVFNRSFSTKGGGRGLGTYSIKLLSERYLKGKVSFESGEKGTTFFARYPLILE